MARGGDTHLFSNAHEAVSVHQQPHRVLNDRFGGIVGLLDGLGLCLAVTNVNDKVTLVGNGGNAVNLEHNRADACTMIEGPWMT